MWVRGIATLALLASLHAFAEPGYYRQSAISADSIVFVAEGDLWRVALQGGPAQRLTSHPAEESTPAISPDGNWLAFTARYEGPVEVYVMPIAGGLPNRLTFDGASATRVVGWTPEGKILYASARYSGKPDVRLYAVDPQRAERSALPLAEAAEGCYLGGSLYFARLPLFFDNVRSYRGGRAQSLWKFDGHDEAVALTADYAGTSRQPMCWEGRVYFLSDRDGTMNLWSMDTAGKDLRQHTRHQGWDIRGASLAAGRVAYQLGADIHLYEIASGADHTVTISLVSDFEHTRTRWIKTPFDYVTDIALSPDGDRVALTVRGQVIVTPAGAGRRVEVTRSSAARARSAVFMPDGKLIVAFSDATGEVELWSFPSNGAGAAKQLTRDGTMLRREAVPSPDGKWIVHHGKDRRLYLLDVASGKNSLIDRSEVDQFGGFAWSPDSRWLAYGKSAGNFFDRLWLREIATGKTLPLTSDRYDANDPAFSADGKFLYFISRRNLQSVVRSPWGQRSPEPFFDLQSRIYGLALTKDARWPYLPRNELHKPEPDTKPDAERKTDTLKAAPADAAAKGSGADATNAQPTSNATPKAPAPKPVVIDLDGLSERLYEVPLAAGNFSELATDGKRLYFLSADTAVERKKTLRTLAIESPNPQPPTAETFFDDVRQYALSLDRKKILLRRANELWVVDAGAKAPQDLAKSVVNLRDWTFQLDPREEWRQIFVDAWRLHRDYFFDQKMRGTDWNAARDKYAALLDRITDRAELDDLIAQMVSELSALHSRVFTPDLRKGPDEIDVGALGADLTRVSEGFRVDKLYRGDPELLEEYSPLARPEAGIVVGDVLTHINGVTLVGAASAEALLRNQVDKQVLLGVKRANGRARDVVVTPVAAQRDAQLRYLGWEWERKARTEAASPGRIGYLHLQAMNVADIARWAREYYPVFQREGLILDLRSNQGGNIDSWVIEKLQRRAWMFWKSRDTDVVYWNQQLAFRGHVVALIDSNTYSDGETMAEGLKRLGIAPLIGSRTAGAGVWLTDANRLRDNGQARAAEFGQFVADGTWLVEGVGVTPDIAVDNLPHATFNDQDAQLEAAIRYLQTKLASDPHTLPVPPAYPANAR